MRLYVVFGEYTERVSEYLSSSYNIIGQERTLDAAADHMQECPDVVLVLGNALLSGMVGKNVNYGAMLVGNLKKIRQSCPKSRIVVILSTTAEQALVESVVQLGIYDIHQVDRISIDSLVTYIETSKDFANYDVDVDVDVDGKPGNVDFKDVNSDKPPLDFARAFGKLRKQIVTRLPRPPRKSGSKKLITELTALTSSGLMLANDPGMLKPEAFFVPCSWSYGDVRSLRREYGLIPIVLVGQPDNAESYYQVGIDRCVSEITDSLLVEIREHSRRIQELQRQAAMDSLTGCYTRGFGERWLAEQGASSIILLDIDDFKVINDTYGHPAGDKVLKIFAGHLLSFVRASDAVIRWGGEEFVIGLPYTTTDEAGLLSERLLDGWRNVSIKLNDEDVKITFSGGIGRDIETADVALYAAKEQGKDRVLIHGKHERVPTLAIAFGGQSEDIASELDDKYEIACCVSTIEGIDRTADKFLLCGKSTTEFIDSVKKLRADNPKSRIVVVYGAGLPQEIKEDLSDVYVFESEQFNRSAMEYWLGGGSQTKQGQEPNVKPGTEAMLDKPVACARSEQPSTKAVLDESTVSVKAMASVRSESEILTRSKAPGASGESKAVKPRLPATSKVLAVWSPVGHYITQVSLGLASAYGDAILANFNFDNPELDYHFGLDHDAPTLQNTGILTMGDQLTMDIVSSLLKKKEGVYFLAAGYGFGIDTIPCNILEDTIDTLATIAKIVIISPCARYNAPSTAVALSKADAVMVPFHSEKELMVIEGQVSELSRLDVLDQNKVVELYQSPTKTLKQVYRHRVQGNWQSIAMQLQALFAKGPCF